MTDFAFTELVNGQPADVISTCLGAAANARFVEADIGKPVKMGTANNYVLCSSGDEIEGFAQSLEAATYNNGFSFGGVLRNTRKIAKVGASQVGTLTVGEYAVAGAPSALGTKDEYPLVIQGAPTNFKWRVIRVLSGTGVAGDLVLLEKV